MEDDDDTALGGNEVGLLVPGGVGSGAIHAAVYTAERQVFCFQQVASGAHGEWG